MAGCYYYFDARGRANPFERSNQKWNDCTVRRILSNEAYLGHTIQHKEECLSYKDYHTRAVSPDEWIRAEDTHEPIITKELWEECRRVDNLRSKQTAPEQNEGGGPVQRSARLRRLRLCHEVPDCKTQEKERHVRTL